MEKEEKSTALTPRKRHSALATVKILNISILFCFDVLQQNKQRSNKGCRIL